ncbi:MAG: helix-turn-helix domain-containing protein [Spirochaetales bacterium]|nr:helix-turn-helix domain-containing protein [Candidatus Physcosoma equi]
MEKTTISVQELAAQLGISLAKTYELVKRPGFPTIRIGTRILIPVELFNDWLRRNSTDGSKEE